MSTRINSKIRGGMTIVMLLITLLMVVACKHDFFEKGDSGLSYLNTDFVEVRSNDASELVEAVTDKGEHLLLRPYVKKLWAVKPDTTYRAMLYYNKVVEGVTKAIDISPVPVLQMKFALDVVDIHTDPVTFESAWISKNRRYLNLGLSLKTGKVDDKKVAQSLAIVVDSVKRRSDGGKNFYMRLYHAQYGVPEYYSARIFVSMPMTNIKTRDSIVLDINTYNGMVRKYF